MEFEGQTHHGRKDAAARSFAAIRMTQEAASARAALAQDDKKDYSKPPGRAEARASAEANRLKGLRLDADDAALADFEDMMLSGNEVKIDIRDGLAVDAHRSLPHQPARLVGRDGEAELL